MRIYTTDKYAQALAQPRPTPMPSSAPVTPSPMAGGQQGNRPSVEPSDPDAMMDQEEQRIFGQPGNNQNMPNDFPEVKYQIPSMQKKVNPVPPLSPSPMGGMKPQAPSAPMAPRPMF